jgi:hypothetical protein
MIAAFQGGQKSEVKGQRLGKRPPPKLRVI